MMARLERTENSIIVRVRKDEKMSEIKDEIILSGGEIQPLKLASQLQKEGQIYLLDERP